MVLYFLRHASAGQPVSNPKKDEKRALDETGIEQCGYVGRALAALDAQVDVIISSPLKRAAQTASLVGNEMGHEGKLQLEDALRPTATFADFRKMLDKYARHDAIMVVGHNPTLSEFLGRAISESGCEAAIDLKKGRGGAGRNESQCRVPDLVPDAQDFAHALRCRGGKLATENFTEIGFLFFHRPQFQIDAGSRLGLARSAPTPPRPSSHAGSAHRAAASQIESARQPQQERGFTHEFPVGWRQDLNERVSRRGP